MMTPPIGVPDFSMSAAASPFLTTQPQAVPNIPIQPHGMLGGLLGGMFGGGKVNLGNVIAGALSGYLAQRGNPAGTVGLQALLARRQAEQTRQQQLADHRAMWDYELLHPKPTEPHYFQDNSGNEMAIGVDGKPVTIYKDPNPWKLVPNGMGGVIPVNMQALMSGANPSMPPPQGMPAIGAVVPDPRKQGGAGAAVPPPTFPY